MAEVEMPRRRRCEPTDVNAGRRRVDHVRHGESR
jgi:hypothetical protein